MSLCRLVKWVIRKVSGKTAEEEDESYANNKVERLSKEHQNLCKKMEAKIEEYTHLQKLDKISKLEINKLKNRIKVFQQNLEKLNSNFEELSNTEFTETDKRLSEIHTEYHQSNQAYFDYEING